MRQSHLRPEFVEFIPERLIAGTIYISRRYRTASHLCCCGCGLEVVTPLNSAKWRLVDHPGDKVSLYPSIGNWGFPCQSHYFLEKNRIEWASALTPEQVAAVKASDLSDAVILARASWSRWAKIGDAAMRIRADFIEAITRALRGG